MHCVSLTDIKNKTSKYMFFKIDFLMICLRSFSNGTEAIRWICPIVQDSPDAVMGNQEHPLVHKSVTFVTCENSCTQLLRYVYTTFKYGRLLILANASRVTRLHILCAVCPGSQFPSNSSCNVTKNPNIVLCMRSNYTSGQLWTFCESHHCQLIGGPFWAFPWLD